MHEEMDRVDTSKIQYFDSILRQRVTRKVLAAGPSEPRLAGDTVSAMDQQVKDAIGTSGWAPFHYDRKKDGIPEPWRYTLFFNQACRGLAAEFDQIFDNIKPNNKIPKMLQACGALVLVTWIPESDRTNEKLVQINEEHLAAAAAATQNLILALEARGFGTYWSSGGMLGNPEFFNRYAMDPEARLIAAVFVNYPGLYDDEGCEVIAGKNREKRTDWSRWTRIIE